MIAEKRDSTCLREFKGKDEFGTIPTHISFKSWSQELSNDIWVEGVLISSVPSIRRVKCHLLPGWEFGIMIVDAENREFEGTDELSTPSTHISLES